MRETIILRQKHETISGRNLGKYVRSNNLCCSVCSRAALYCWVDDDVRCVCRTSGVTTFSKDSFIRELWENLSE